MKKLINKSKRQLK